MRIAFVSTQLGWGGGENLLSQLLLGLCDKGVESHLVALQESKMLEWGVKQANLPTLALPGKGRGPRAMWKLRRWVQKQRCDLLLLNDPHAITYGGIATLGLGIPRLGVRHTCFPVNSGWKHNRLLSKVICVAKAARQECLLAGVDDDRLEVIYNGLPNLKIAEEDQRLARELFQSKTNPNEKHLLAVGSLLPVKAFGTAIQAVAHAVKDGKRWHLWIAGEGPERQQLTQLAEELGVSNHVHLLGFRNDVRALLSRADAFVSTSQKEGLPLVLIEAMQVGCPVVATPVGGCGEILFANETIDEPVSWTFEPGDTKGLIEGLTAALDPKGDASNRVEAAQRWADHQFSLERMTRGYLEVAKRQIAA